MKASALMSLHWETKVLQCVLLLKFCLHKGIGLCVYRLYWETKKNSCVCVFVCVQWPSCEPKWATYNPWGFGALWIVGKAATVTSGDCVWLLVTEAHGVHRLASAADDPLQREMRRYCQWIVWFSVSTFGLKPKLASWLVKQPDQVIDAHHSLTFCELTA